MTTSDSSIDTGTVSEEESPDPLTLSAHDPEKDSISTPSGSTPTDIHGPAPDGGLRAWLVAAGSGAVFFCCMGFANAFGTFEEYYLTHQLQGYSADDVAWIGSLSNCLQFLCGLASGPLFDRYGAKVIRPAAILYIIAMMLLSLCKEYYQFMLVQAVLMGSTIGFLQIPAFASVAQYFDKKRAAAYGIAVSGSSIGGVVMPIALSKLLNGTSIGFGWSVRIIGFMIMPFLLFACVVIVPRLPPTTSSFWIPSAFKDIRYTLLIAGLFFTFTGMFTPMYYVPSYAVSRGVSPSLAGYFLAIINGASTFGRVIPGVLADKYGRLNILAGGGIITAITIFCMNSATTTAGFVVYSIFFGFFSGTIVSGASAAFSICTDDPRQMGTYLGMALALAGFGGLIGPPINGALVSHYGGYSQVAIFSGVMVLFGGFIALFTKTRTKQGIWGNV